MPAASIVLASASPRRKELLERAGFSVKPVPASIDEEPIAGETPIGYTKRLAREKVLTAVRRLQSTHVSDTKKSSTPVMFSKSLMTPTRVAADRR